MMREDADTKARRLVAADQVQVLFADEHRIVARVRGDHGIYDLEWDRGDWSCTCAARGACSHIEAVHLVTLQPLRAASAPNG